MHHKCDCLVSVSVFLLLVPLTDNYAAAAKSFQSCPTLCDPIDGSPPGSPSLGFSRQEHWSGLPFSLSNAWKWKVKVKLLSHVWLLATPFTAAYQADQPREHIKKQKHYFANKGPSSQDYGEGNGTPLQYSCLENPMEEPGGVQSMGSLGVGHDWVTSLSIFTFMHWRRKWQPTPVFLPGESQGRGSLVGCCLWGHTESDTIEVT